MITQDRLKELFSYDPATGIFVRLYVPGKRSDLCGKPVGTNERSAYSSISIDGVKYKAHRLAWLYVHGRWPASDVDHRDRCKSHNMFANLREATRSQNEQNKPVRRTSTSGVTGVYRNKHAKKWQAYIKLHGKHRYLGIFEKFEDAVQARKAAEESLFGEFAAAC